MTDLWSSKWETDEDYYYLHSFYLYIYIVYIYNLLPVQWS